MFGFSADLSWTDHNDQINKEKIEQQQRQRAESRATQHSHHSDTSSVRSIKTRRTTSSDGLHRQRPKFSLFRSRSRTGEAQRDIHSSAGSYVTNWTNGWSVASTDGPRTPPLSPAQSPPVSLAISPPRPAPNQFARQPFVPSPLFSSPYGYSAFAECK
jgi:hypothetical protein